MANAIFEPVRAQEKMPERLFKGAIPPTEMPPAVQALSRQLRGAIAGQDLRISAAALLEIYCDVLIEGSPEHDIFNRAVIETTAVLGLNGEIHFGATDVAHAKSALEALASRGLTP